MIVMLEVDATGFACPMPLLKARQGLNQLQSGQVLKVQATDAGSVRDFHSFCELSGHKMLEFIECDNRYTYFLEKA